MLIDSDDMDNLGPSSANMQQRLKKENEELKKRNKELENICDRWAGWHMEIMHLVGSYAMDKGTTKRKIKKIVEELSNRTASSS